MRDSGILALRLTLGGYLAAHGAQKLFGKFNGPGLDKAGVAFGRMGLEPGKPFAALAATSELTGGVLTAAGLAFPVGPVAIAGAMAAAVAVHSDHGAMGQKGGYELPLTDMMAALALAITGPGRYSLDRILPGTLPKNLVRLTVIGATAMSAFSVSKILEQKRAGAAPDPASDAQGQQVPDPAAG